MKRLLPILLLLAGVFLHGQQSFQLEIVPAHIEGLPAVYGYTLAQYHGKWLVIGGKTNDPRQGEQPNIELTVVDPVFKKTWSVTLHDLALYLEDAGQLTAAYAQYYQEDRTLYLLGGFGYSQKTGRNQTFPYLTTVAVDRVIEAVVAGRTEEIGPAFCQYYEEDFALMKGVLTRIDHKYYLVGGVRCGEDEPQSVPRVQEFVLREDEYGNVEMIRTGAYTYESKAATRYTYAPQLFPDGTPGVTAFWNDGALAGNQEFNWMNIYGDGYSHYALPGQSAPSYHGAVIPVYDELYNTMHSLFLGGCTDYLCSGEPVFGDPVRVDHFVRFSRGAGGKIAVERETMIPFVLQGRKARFILHQPAPHYENGVIRLDEIPAGRVLVGYLYGGISRAPQGALLEEGYLTVASDQFYLVYLRKEEVLLGRVEF